MADQQQDQGADFVFTSRSFGSTPERIATALAAEGIFITSTSEVNDGGEVVTKPAEQPAETPTRSEKPASEQTDDTGKTVDADETSAGDEDKPKGTDAGHKPGVKERLRAKNAELTSKVEQTAAELRQEREQRESLARELEALKSGKREPASDLSRTTTTVAKTEETPAESQPRPTRPKEEDFWEEADPTEAFEAAQTKYEDNLVDWRLAESTRAKQVTEEAKRREQETKSFEDLNEAEQRARVDRWNAQVEDAKLVHADFKESVQAMSELTMPMIEAAHASEITAEIAYYLAKNPEAADRIREATRLPDKATPGQISKAMRKATEEFIKIEAILAEAEDSEDTEVTEQPVAEARKPAATAPATPVKKYIPVTPVGGRGGKSQKTFAELSHSDNPDDLNTLRNMSLDELRKLKAG